MEDLNLSFLSSQQLFGPDTQPKQQRTRQRANRIAQLGLPPFRPPTLEDELARDGTLKEIPTLDEEEESVEAEQPVQTINLDSDDTGLGASNGPRGGSANKNSSGSTPVPQDTLQAELRSMGISLNRLLGTTQAKMSKRQQLLTPQKGNYEAEKLQFLENYLKAGELVDRATGHHNRLLHTVEETGRVVAGLQISITPKVMQCNSKLLDDWEKATRKCEETMHGLLTDHLKKIATSNQDKIHILIQRIVAATK